MALHRFLVCPVDWQVTGKCTLNVSVSERVILTQTFLPCISPAMSSNLNFTLHGYLKLKRLCRWNQRPVLLIVDNPLHQLYHPQPPSIYYENMMSDNKSGAIFKWEASLTIFVILVPATRHKEIHKTRFTIKTAFSCCLFITGFPQLVALHVCFGRFLHWMPFQLPPKGFVSPPETEPGNFHFLGTVLATLYNPTWKTARPINISISWTKSLSR